MHSGTAAKVGELESRQLLAGTWTALANPNPNGGSGSMLLLSDGTLMVQGGGVSKDWSKLTPDSGGNYINGTWSARAPMSLERLYTGSVVMPNGKVFILGGEYSGPAGSATWVNSGEIYDPVSNTWTPTAPFPQPNFGDGQAVLLSNGKILCGYLSGFETYLYDPASNSWTQTGSKIHNDRNNEETWVLLPDGSVLSYDIFGSPESGSGSAQRYRPSTGTWIDAGVVPVPLTSGALGSELGPGALLPDGRLIQVGANNKTAIYTPSTNSWVAGPTLPNNMGGDDSPGAMLPNGHFLFLADTSIPLFTGPTKIYDFDPTTNSVSEIIPSAAVTASLSGAAYTSRLLITPNGHMLLTSGDGTIYDYAPDGAPQAAWAPAIANISQTASFPVPVFTLSGTQLTGLSEGASYGDDAGLSTNYPIVRLKNGAGVIKYARTFNWTPGVATGNLVTTVQFTMPAGFSPNGVYQASVIANGIASPEFTMGTSNLLKDIFAGSNSSSPHFLTDVNGTLFFVADNGINGPELWKSDGTKAGTVMVKDIHVGSAGSDPQNLVNVNGTLFFSANDSVKGTELWKSDGTTAGTVLVSDIRAGVGSSLPSYLTNVNGTLFFQANNGTKGTELWKSDGTAAGTVMVKDIRAGAGSSTPTYLTNASGVLYFVATDGVTGAELWKSDGTTAGTVLVKDIRTGGDSSAPTNLTWANGSLYLVANNGSTGNELWKSDGTAAGTVLVSDIDPRASIGSNPSYLTAFNGKLFFQATTATYGPELWGTDGTAAGTTLVKDLNPGAVGSVPVAMYVYKGAMYFQANDPFKGFELWKSDGTAAGTSLFVDINTTGLNSSSPTGFTNVAGTLYFSANDGSTGFELWKTDGTVAGTKRALDIASGSTSSNPSNLLAIGSKLYFSANNSFNGIELWLLPVTPVPGAAPSVSLVSSSSLTSTSPSSVTSRRDARMAARRARSSV